MSQILLTKKKYNFKIGYVIKIEKLFYEIQGIEWLQHYELIDSVAAGVSGEQSFETELKPGDGYVYWIEEMGIDGALGFQLKYPSVPRWTVHGNKRYFYRHQASFMNLMYKPFLVKNPEYPRFTFFNPERAAKTAIMYFEGEKWLIKKLELHQVGDYYTDLTSYSDKSIGEG